MVSMEKAIMALKNTTATGSYCRNIKISGYSLHVYAAIWD
jgi:hypothetical protein